MAQNKHNVLMSTLICLVLTHLLNPRLPTQHLFSDVWRHLKLSKTKLSILHPTSTTTAMTTQTLGTPPIVFIFENVATPPFQLFRSQINYAAAAAKSLQSCPTLCDPIDGSPPGSPVPGILQARTLECVAISLSNAWKWKVKGKSLSRVRPSETPCTAALQAPPSMGFSRQEYWSGVPLPSPN